MPSRIREDSPKICLLYYTIQPVSEKEVEQCVRYLFNEATSKKNKGYIEQESIKHDKYNVSFIPVEALSEAERFTFYSEYMLDPKVLMAEVIAGYETPPKIISLTGDLIASSVVVESRWYYDLLKDIAKNINIITGNKFVFAWY